LAAKTTQERFAEIYRTNAWKNPESRSGYGSTLACTRTLRQGLPALIKQLDIHALLDAPCGDFNWMKHVDLGVDRYIGADIVPDLIERLNAQYGNERRSFMVIDLVRGPLPQADALFCRDCYLHFSYADVRAALATFAKSQCSHLIASTYPTLWKNVDIVTGEARALNLQRAPFNLPEPVGWLADAAEGDAIERRMGVWKREQILNSLHPAATG
jgi:hypothetical protein